jgi:hypothetical protein
MKTFVILWQYILILLRLKNFPNKVVEKTEAHLFKFSNFFFFRNSWQLWDNVEKHGTARQTTNDKKNMAHAHCMLDTYDYK